MAFASPPRLPYTELWSCACFCIAARRASPTAGTSSSWSSFTNDVCRRSATSSGRTECPTSRSWRSAASPALSAWTSSASWDGQYTSSEWRITESRRCCRRDRWKRGIATREDPSRGTRTLWRWTSRAPTLTWTLGKQLPVTELFGHTSAHKARKTLKSTEQLRSWQRKRGGNSTPLLWIHSYAASVAAHLCHELVFIPTWGSTSANDLSAYSSVVSTGESTYVLLLTIKWCHKMFKIWRSNHLTAAHSCTRVLNFMTSYYGLEECRP